MFKKLPGLHTPLALHLGLSRSVVAPEKSISDIHSTLGYWRVKAYRGYQTDRYTQSMPLLVKT